MADQNQKKSEIGRRTFLAAGGAAAAATALAPAVVGSTSAAFAVSSFAISSDAAFFDNVTLTYSGLAATNTAVSANDIPSAIRAYIAWENSRTSPTYFFSPADRTRFASSLSSDSARASSILSTANDLYNYIFYLNGETRTYSFGAVVWTGPGEWPNVLNRFQWLRTLALATYISGDSKYIARGHELIQDFIAKNPVIDVPTTGSSPWRALEVGIRTGAWLDFLGLVRGQAGSVAADEFAIRRSLMEHGNYLASYMSSFQPGNWQANAAGPFAWLGIMNPDWKNGSAWFATGRQRTEQQLLSATNADGFQVELATIYHTGVFTTAAQTLTLARSNGLPDFTAAGLARLGNAYNVLFQLRYPNGIDPTLGDGPADFDGGTAFAPNEYLSAGAVLVNPAFKTLSPAGASVDLALLFGWAIVDSYLALATPTTSRPPISSLPASNMGIFRSGDTADRQASTANSLQLVLDASGTGIGGHSHPDALQILAYAYGRSLLIDPGYGISYSTPEYSEYFKTTRAHNTVVIDGTDQPRLANGTPAVGLDNAVALSTVDYARGHFDDYSGVDHVREAAAVGDEYWVVRDVLRPHDSSDIPTPLPIAGSVASSEHNASWKASNVLDGNGSTAWSSIQSAAAAGEDWIYVRLSAASLVSEVVLYPRVYSSASVYFPVDFVLESSLNGSDWTPIPGQAYSGFPSPPASASGVKFVLTSPVVASYVRVHSSKRRLYLGTYYCQLADITVSGATSTSPVAIPLLAASASTTHGALVAANAIDSNSATFWSSERGTSASSSTSIFVDAGKVVVLGQISLVARVDAGSVIYFPVDFSLESSLDGITWVAVPGFSFTNYPQPASSQVNFTLASTIRARYVRISITKMSSYLSAFYAQFAEIRIQGYPSQIRQLDQLWHFWPGNTASVPGGMKTAFTGTSNVTVLSSALEPVEIALESGFVANAAATANVASSYLRFTQRTILPASFESVLYPDPQGRVTAVSILDRIYAAGYSAMDAVGLKIAVGSRVDCVYFNSVGSPVTFNDGFVASEGAARRTL